MEIYTTPQLTVHGSVEDITKELGTQSIDDTIFNNTGDVMQDIPAGESTQGAGGSLDVIITPEGPTTSPT